MTSLQRKNAKQLGEIIKDCLRFYGISPKINRRLIDEAWYQASGASEFTKNVFYRNGTLYITVNSSVIRSQLSFQKDALRERMNALLSENTLFDDRCSTAGYIDELIIK